MPNRAKESRAAAKVLREILAAKQVTAKRRRALEIAISVLEARAFDGDNDE
jgi:hypothetical protein